MIMPDLRTERLAKQIDALIRVRNEERSKTEQTGVVSDVARRNEVELSLLLSKNAGEILKNLTELMMHRDAHIRLLNIVPPMEGITFGGDAALYVTAYIRRLESKVAQLSHVARDT